MTLTFNALMQAMVMTYSHAKVQGQWSVVYEDRMETNGQMDGGDCITCRINVVSNQVIAMAFSALTPLAGCQEGHPARKNLTDEVLAWLSSRVKCK